MYSLHHKSHYSSFPSHNYVHFYFIDNPESQSQSKVQAQNTKESNPKVAGRCPNSFQVDTGQGKEKKWVTPPSTMFKQAIIKATIKVVVQLFSKYSHNLTRVQACPCRLQVQLNLYFFYRLINFFLVQGQFLIGRTLDTSVDDIWQTLCRYTGVHSAIQGVSVPQACFMNSH